MMAFEPLFLLALLAADLRQRRVQAQHLDPGRRALRARRSAPRPRLLDLLRRHQPRRVPGAARLRHARRGARLALWLRRRRRRHDDRACDLSLRHAHAAARRAAARTRAGERRNRFGRDEWRAVGALILLALPVTLLLGHLRAGRQHHRAVGRRLHRPRPSALFDFNPDHLVPGVQSVPDLRLHAARPGALEAAGRARPRALDRRQDGLWLLRSTPPPI